MPVRRNKGGETEVLLVATRGKRPRRIIPKGGRSKELRDKDAAAREACEEGGVTGRTRSRPVGALTHRKHNGVAKKVKVFRLDVDRDKRRWPEQKERKRLWARPQEAKRLVRPQGLRRIIDQP